MFVVSARRTSRRSLPDWRKRYLRSVTIADLCAAVVAVTAVFLLHLKNDLTWQYETLEIALPFLWIVVLRITGGYDSDFIALGAEESRKVLESGLIFIAALVIISDYTDHWYSRNYLLIAMLGVIVLDLFARFAVRRWFQRLRSAGRCMSSLLVVGHEESVAEFVTEVRRDKYHGFYVPAVCLAQSSEQAKIAGVPVFGGLDDIAGVARRIGADAVAVLPSPEIDSAGLRSLAWELEKFGALLYLSPNLLDVSAGRTRIRPIAGLTLLHVSRPQLSAGRLFLKDVFDRCAAGIALILLSPLMLGIAVAIRLSDKGPSLFTQTRVGKDGRVFKIYKYRTMVVDAEQRLSQLMAGSEIDGVLFKMRRDPRITEIGARLRRWSVDELPTLFNVLKGDMSLVGPRPALPSEAATYAYHVRRRMVVKPGITGLWQINGRSDLSWEESVRLDLRYVENWSFMLDLQILWKTISVLFRGSGAY